MDPCEEKKAVQAGMYTSALSLLAGVAMTPAEKELHYANILPNARVFLSGFPVALTETFAEFAEQREWQSRIIALMQDVGLNGFFAFGMALHMAQVYPQQAQSHIRESGKKIGLPSSELDSLAFTLLTAGVDERSRLIDDFIESQFKPSLAPIRIFLCHGSEDKAKVRDLYRRLKAEGAEPWLDEEDILPGQDWESEIARAVRKADVVVVCLSKRTVTKSGYVQREIKKALDVAEEQPEGTIYIIPVMLEPCEVPERLARWQWLDMYRDNGYERLCASLSRVRAKQTSDLTMRPTRGLKRTPDGAA